jgi:hypothetical protein
VTSTIIFQTAWSDNIAASHQRQLAALWPIERVLIAHGDPGRTDGTAFGAEPSVDCRGWISVVSHTPVRDEKGMDRARHRDRRTTRGPDRLSRIARLHPASCAGLDR